MKSFLLKIIWFILRLEARLVLLVKRPKIIAVTGSVAKTTTKEAIYWILKENYKVWRSPGNLNAEIGIPLTILGYKKEKSPSKFLLPFYLIWGFFKALLLIILPYPKILILEMGIEHKGDIKYFTKLAKPSIAVVTVIGPVHLELFGDLGGVYNEKADLVRDLSENDWAVLNKSDENAIKMAGETKAKVKYFQSETIDISNNAAVAVGEIFGLDKNTCEEKLKSFKAPKQRLNVIKTDSLTIIDDSYNSNPLATEASLRKLEKMEGSRKIAVLGDMLELGSYEAEGHRKIGELASQICDLVLFVGDNTALFKKGAEKNLPAEKILEAPSAEKAGEKLLKIIEPHDIILIKGSRKVGLEKLVKLLDNQKELHGNN